MKGFAHLFRFSCLSVLVVLFDDSIGIQISTDITSNYCKHPLEFAALESYYYIDDQLRYDLCKRTYPKEFDLDSKIGNVYKKCLGPRHQLTVFHNPCAVVCPTANDFYYEESAEEKDCKDFLTEYTNMTRVILITDEHKGCGPNYHCNPMGCCVKRESETQVTEKPKTETVAPTAHTTTPPTTTTTPVPTAPPTIATRKPENLCHSLGTFKYPNDSSKRKYYVCTLKAELKVCPFGEIFDEKLSKCKSIATEPPTTPTPPPTTPTIQTTTTPAIDWKKYFKCTEEGFFRNPYDCTRYYQCYRDDGGARQMRFAEYICAMDHDQRLVFDQHPGIDKETGKEQDPTCVRRADYVRQHGVCKEEPLPDHKTNASHF